MACYCRSEEIEAAYRGEVSIECSAPLVIFGSRSYTEGREAAALADEILDVIDHHDIDYDCIVSGGASGADDVGEVVGVKTGTPVAVFNVGSVEPRHSLRDEMSGSPYEVDTVSRYAGPSEDPKSGNGAYLYRNCLMAEWTAQHDGRGLAIWDGDSTGTQHMMSACESHGIPYEVFLFERGRRRRA